MQRQATQTITAHRQLEGGGFPVRRPIPSMDVQQLDPFLLLDEMGPVDWPPGDAIGAPSHPHRGFETVTYLLAGSVEHRDSAGNHGVMGPGDVQWMTAGRGVVHSELPAADFKRRGGAMHGFQLWVNLPAAQKMSAPRYQDLKASQLPTVDGDGFWARILAGEAHGVSAVIDTHTPIALYHYRVDAGGQLVVPLPAELNGYVYTFEGELEVAGSDAEAGQMVSIDDGGDEFTLKNKSDSSAQCLVLGGRPIGEPLARYGPFVMNTRQEIHEAIDDYNAGRIG